MTHPEGRLTDYVDGTLDPGERAEVDAHLAVCGRCHGEVSAAAAARAALVALPEAVPPAGVASAALEKAGSVRGRRSVGTASRWYRIAGVAAAAAAALVVVALVLPKIGGGGGTLSTAERAQGGAGISAAAGPKLAGTIEIQDTNYDQTALTAVVASYASAAASTTPGPLDTAQTSATSGTPQQTQRALACIAKAVPAEHGTLTRLIQARFEGKPAYLAVFLEGPGAGQPPDSAVVWVISTKGCSILSSGYAKL